VEGKVIDCLCVLRSSTKVCKRPK